MRTPSRRTGTASRPIGLPGEESRCLLQDLAFLAQHLVFALELPQPRSLLRPRSARSLRSASSCRCQLCSVCSEQPSSAANCFGVRTPLRNNFMASRWNSGGYGGLVLGITHAPLPGQRPKASRCQQDRATPSRPKPSSRRRRQQTHRPAQLARSDIGRQGSPGVSASFRWASCLTGSRPTSQPVGFPTARGMLFLAGKRLVHPER